MAIDAEIWGKAKALFMKGDSLSSIAKETGISKGAIGKKSHKEAWGKETITILARQEVENIIIANEIKETKDTFTTVERDTYQDVFIDLMYATKTFNNSTMKAQSILDKALHVIAEQTEEDKEMAIAHLPNVLAITKGTQANRLQILGQTALTVNKGKEDDDKVIEWV